jgi:serine/threonine protein kinase
MHGQDIVHRDLKPENILFENNEPGNSRLRLVDFGFARILPSRSANNGSLSATAKSLITPLCGTLHYAAPEVLDIEDELPQYNQVRPSEQHLYFVTPLMENASSAMRFVEPGGCAVYPPFRQSAIPCKKSSGVGGRHNCPNSQGRILFRGSDLDESFATSKGFESVGSI